MPSSLQHRAKRICLLTLMASVGSSVQLSWARQDLVATHPDPHSFSTQDLGLSQAEHAALFRTGDLHPYSHKPDCFRNAAHHIRTRCSALELDEGLRVRAAIAMTLCELQTAQYRALPLECEAFSTDVAAALAYDAPYAPCVEAISRSAQFWASYSGYLREIPQLCFAFQRGNDINEAQEIYKNATLEKLALLRHLNTEDEQSGLRRRHWEHLIAETNSAVGELRAASSVVDDVAAGIAERTTNTFQELLLRYETSLASAQQQHEHQRASALSQHATALATLAHDLPRTLSLHLNTLFDALDTRTRDMALVSDRISSRYEALHTSLHAAEQTVGRVAAHAHNASAQLSTSTRHAARGAAQLGAAVAQVAARARAEMEGLNGTAAAVRREMQMRSAFVFAFAPCDCGG